MLKIFVISLICVSLVLGENRSRVPRQGIGGIDAVRLVGGQNFRAGRLEILSRGVWGTVCGHNFDLYAASVVCRSLGFQSNMAGLLTSTEFSIAASSIPILTVDLRCHGNEPSLNQCLFGVNIPSSCNHLQDVGISCGARANNFLLMADATARQIYRMDLSTFSYAVIPNGIHHNPIAIGYDHVEETIYWSDVVERAIKKSDLNGSNSVILLQLPTGAVPDGLAVDPISRNLFFTDTGHNTITVIRLDGRAHKVIIASGLSEPRGIAVYPSRGIIFWTDWGSQPKIERSNMDGTDRSTLISSSLTWPNGITIDYPASHIYWLDGSRGTIQRADFNGQNKRTIYSGTGHMFGLTLLQDYIYYTDWRSSNVMRLNKSGQGRRAVGPSIFSRLAGITAYNSEAGIATLSETNGCTDGRYCSSNQICVSMPSNNVRCLTP